MFYTRVLYMVFSWGWFYIRT